MNGKSESFLRFILGRRKLLSLALLGLATIVIWGLNAVKIELGKNITSELQTRLQSNRDNLTLWNQEKTSQVQTWANSSNVKATILSLVRLAESGETTPKTLLESQELTDLRRILGPVCNSHNYVGFVIFNPTGLQIGSLLDQPVGKRDLMDHSDFVMRSLQGETVASLPFVAETPLPTIHGQWKEKWPTMFISAPVRDAMGEVAAVLAFRLRPEIEISRITEIHRIGATGETYAFDSTGLILSNSRFDDQLRTMDILSGDPDQMSMLNVRLIERGKFYNKSNPRLTQAVQKAIKGEGGINIKGYPDYRGVNVIGAWTWVEEYGFGLATKMDVDEAFAPFFIMERVFVSFFVLLLVAIGTFWFLASRELVVENERKKVSGLLEDSEKKSDLILSNTLDGIITIHPNGIIQSFNFAAERIFGYQAEEVIGQNVNMFMTEPDFTDHDSYLKRYLLTGEKRIMGAPREVPAKRKDGTAFNLEIAISEIFLQDERVFIGLVRDITARKKIEEELQEVSRRNELILNTAGDGIYGVDLNGVTTFTNPAGSRMLGYSVEEMVGQSQHALIHHTHKDGTPFPKDECPIYAAFKDGQVHQVSDDIFWKKDGTSIPVEYVSTPIFEEGDLAGVVVVYKDITERKRAEDLSNRMGRILDDSFNEIFIFDVQTYKFVQVNRGACENLGYSPEEILQMEIFEIFPEFSKERFEKLVKPLRRGSAPRIVFEAEQKRKDGSGYPVEVRLQLTSVGSRPLFLATVQDITDRRMAELAQLQAQNVLEARVTERTGELKEVNETLIDEIADRKVIEIALRDSDAQIRAIVENVVDAIVTINEEGIVELFNATAEKIFGYTASEVIGKPINMLMPEPYKGEHDGYMQNYRETGDAKIIGTKREVWGLRKDGSVFPMDLAVNEFYIGDRRAYTGIIRDITEKKQAQKSLERVTRQNELILKSVGDGIFGVNLEGEIIFYNSSALKMIRFDEEDLEGKSLHHALRIITEEESSLKLDYPLYQVFRDGLTQARDEEVFWKKDGSALLAEYICAPIYEDEKIVGAVVTFRDILRRKRSEEALVQAKEEAERANEAKSDFLSRMSHELRTPLNSILGFAQIMEMDTLDRLTERQTPWVSQIRKAGDHLLELINEILDLARIESGRMTVSLENINIVPLLKEVLILVLPMSTERNLKIINMISIPSLVVFADRIRLKQVLLNLLSNAVKYNIENGLITLYYRITSKGDIRVSIEDSGIGFSHSQIQELFEPFSRLDADNTEVQGTGIGLTITRRLIEQMRGDILVESTQGKGSCFTVELPAGVVQENGGPQENREIEAIPETLNNEKDYTILYIEDNEDNLILIRQVMKARSNINLITAKDGKTGVEIALAHCPDLILMDINLPGIDGFAALKALRAYKKTSAIPVVAVSANAMKDDIEYGLEAGFDSYVTKPINMVHLMDVVTRFLEKNHKASLNSSLG